MIKKLTILASIFFSAVSFANEAPYPTANHCAEFKNSIKMSVVKMADKNGKKLVQIKLTEANGEKPVMLDDLKEVHTKKVHLLIIDDSLTDYKHIHPKSLGDGLYEFEWKPKKSGNYRMWADLTPLNKNMQEYVMVDLVSGKQAKPVINRSEVLTSKMNGYNFKLSLDGAMGKITVTDSKGKSVKILRPVMGAYAHIVGFSEDMSSVVHIHPMGAEPKTSKDRGGPELDFHMESQKAGFVKLFAQVNINGKEMFVPFGIMVK